MTNLRYLRLKYHLFLSDLEPLVCHKHQQISRFELGDRKPSEFVMKRYQMAFEQLILSKKETALQFEQDYLKVKDHLFEEAVEL